jgi:hypothetical protein
MVRVRQRALQKSRKSRLFAQIDLLIVERAVEPFMELSVFRTASGHSHRWHVYLLAAGHRTCASVASVGAPGVPQQADSPG